MALDFDAQYLARRPANFMALTPFHFLLRAEEAFEHDQHAARCDCGRFLWSRNGGRFCDIKRDYFLLDGSLTACSRFCRRLS
jgi:hypothetical protein